MDGIFQDVEIDQWFFSGCPEIAIRIGKNHCKTRDLKSPCWEKELGNLSVTVERKKATLTGQW
jgi:hypothetical protein